MKTGDFVWTRPVTPRRLYYGCQQCQIAHWEGDENFIFHQMFSKGIKVSEFTEEEFCTVLRGDEIWQLKGESIYETR